MLKKVVILALLIGLSVPAFAVEDMTWLGAPMSTGDWEDLTMWEHESLGTPTDHYPNGVPGEQAQISTPGVIVNINAGTMDASPGTYIRLGLGLGEGGPHPLGGATLNIAAGAKMTLGHWMAGEHYDSTKYGPLRKASKFDVNIDGQVETTGRISMWSGYNKLTVNDGGNLHTGGYLDLKQPGDRCDPAGHGGPAVHTDNYNHIEVMAGGSFTVTSDETSSYSGVIWQFKEDGAKAGQTAIILHGTAEFVITTSWAKQLADGGLNGTWDGWEQLLQDMANGGEQSGGAASLYEGSAFVTYADDTEGTEVDAYVYQRGDSWVVSAVPDCIVDFHHFARFAQRWMDTPCYAGNDYCGGADLDGLGDVDLFDLSLFVDKWLSSCPSDWPLK